MPDQESMPTRKMAVRAIPRFGVLAIPFLCAGLVFGSLWSYLPLSVMAATLVVRTALEDRTLQRELAGYADYAGKTRYRLFPGIW